MTTVRVEAEPGRARCTLAGGLLRPQVLDVDAGGARVALVTTGAALLGGDTIELDLHVGPGAWLELVEVAGTTVLPSGGADSSTPSTWTTQIQIETGGTLVWAGEPLVVSARAALDRTLVVTLERGGTMAMRETLLLGRSGEIGGSVNSTTRIVYDNVPLFAEDLSLAGPTVDRSGPLDRDRPGILFGARCVDSVLMFGTRPNHEGPPDRLDLEGPGCIARDIRRELHTSDMGGVWTQWRSDLLSQRDVVHDDAAMMRTR